MKIVTSAELCGYPPGTVFRDFTPAWEEKSKANPAHTIVHNEMFGGLQVIVSTTDFQDGSGPTISRDGELFDIYPAECLRMGEEYSITNNGSSSSCGCYGNYDKGLYAVYSKDDLSRALDRLLNPVIREDVVNGAIWKELVR